MDNETTYYSEYRNELLPYVPDKIKKSLDVGCGEGIFSEGLRTKKDIEVWGIEIVKEAAEKAAARLDRVLHGSFEDVYDDIPKNHFDCIFFNDVLEHMLDPYSVLDKSKSLLSDEGVMLCSIPNVRYFPNLYELIAKKDWRYKDSGILDRTHVRFFTRKSIFRMFEELGFEVICVDGVNKIGSRRYRLLYHLVNTVFLGAFSDSYWLQFVCVIRPKM